MNKTVSINLGGFFFHIDEDAFQKLNRYFDAIRQSLSADGRDEIMSDIESRIAELLTEKLKNEKQVVSLREVDEVIIIMGRPEDYRLDDEEKGPGTNVPPFSSYPYGKTKKFYRDEEAGLIGGVCAGLGHYFKVDPLWIRIICIVSLLLSFGSSILIYLLLWILIPKAVTTTEKLEMTGEPINISNIEKKVREGIDEIAAKLQGVDYDKLGANAKYGAERVGSGIGKVFSVAFTSLAKVIGAIISVISAILLGVAVVMLLSLLFTSSFKNSIWYSWLHGFNYSETPVGLLGTAAFFVIAIPLFVLFLLGLKILVNNSKPVGAVTRLTLLVVWLVSAIAIIYVVISGVSEINAEGKTVAKHEINLQDDSILKIKFRYNNYFSKSIYSREDFSFRQDSLGNEIIYSNNISFFVNRTDEKKPFVQIERISNGKTSSEARDRAGKIKYSFKLEGNTLILDNYLLTDIGNKYRNQKVEIYLYLPEGTTFACDDSVEEYDYTDNEFFDLWFDGDHTYIMEENHVKCMDCIAEGTEMEPEVEVDEAGIPLAPAPIGKAAPDDYNPKQPTTQETIRIMELEAERAKMEQERMKLEREIERERIKNNKQ
jgi:phage shock protein PspC (stress-responsive transcriptional regulator)